MDNKKWEKKMNKFTQDWDQKLKKINTEWKKNPKKAIIPIAAILFICVLLINLFSSDSSDYVYIKYKCVQKVKNVTAYNTFELDKKNGLARSAAWVDIYPKKAYQTRRIIKWGDKIVMAPLNIRGDYKNSYFEDDTHHMHVQGKLYTGWTKKKCKKLAAR